MKLNIEKVIKVRCRVHSQDGNMPYILQGTCEEDKKRYEIEVRTNAFVADDWFFMLGIGKTPAYYFFEYDNVKELPND